MLKVLHVYRTYFPETQGGLQEAIRQIARGLARAGCESSVFTLAKNPFPPLLRIDESQVFRSRSVIDISSCDIGSLSGIFRFRNLSKRADILNFHYPWPFGDVLELLGNPGKPYVVTYHSDIVRQRTAEAIYAPLRDRFIRRAAAVVTTSPSYARTSDYLSRIGRSVEVIPLSINVNDIPEVPEATSSTWARRFPEPFFFFVGVLRYYKGLEFLIEAAKQTGFQVVIAGSGPERGRLEYLAAGTPNIHFVGKISDQDKFALFHLSRAVVFPSHLRAEAFGVTLLEGAAMGKPLVSTEIGTGTSYVNVDGETGIVIPPADSHALSAAMRTLMNAPELAARLGQGARERCIRMFDTDTTGRRYRALYERVMASAGQGRA